MLFMMPLTEIIVHCPPTGTHKVLPGLLICESHSKRDWLLRETNRNPKVGSSAVGATGCYHRAWPTDNTHDRLKGDKWRNAQRKIQITIKLVSFSVEFGCIAKWTSHFRCTSYLHSCFPRGGSLCLLLILFRPF